jgi:vacuolar-type H+-ATPase subunit I/STV1
VIGSIAGGLLGLAAPVVGALLYWVATRDTQGAGVFSYLGILTIPMGIVIGGFTGSMWRGDRGILANVLAGIWRAARPTWLGG